MRKEFSNKLKYKRLTSFYTDGLKKSFKTASFSVVLLPLAIFLVLKLRAENVFGLDFISYFGRLGLTEKMLIALSPLIVLAMFCLVQFVVTLFLFERVVVLSDQGILIKGKSRKKVVEFSEIVSMYFFSDVNNFDICIDYKAPIPLLGRWTIGIPIESAVSLKEVVNFLASKNSKLLSYAYESSMKFGPVKIQDIKVYIERKCGECPEDST